MKTEINLRTREFVKSKEFYWPRVIVTLLALLLPAMIISGVLFAYHYRSNLQNELAYLAFRQDELRNKAAPLERMEAEIAAVQARASLLEDLSKDLIPWSGYLRTIEQAAREGTSISRVALAGDGTLVITGRGRTMEGAAIYVQDLNRLEFIGEAAFAYLNYEQEGFAFTLGANIATGGEPDNGETIERESSN